MFYNEIDVDELTSECHSLEIPIYIQSRKDRHVIGHLEGCISKEKFGVLLIIIKFTHNNTCQCVIHVMPDIHTVVFRLLLQTCNA